MTGKPHQPDRRRERDRRAGLEAELRVEDLDPSRFPDEPGRVDRPRPAPNARGRAVDTPRRPRPNA